MVNYGEGSRPPLFKLCKGVSIIAYTSNYNLYYTNDGDNPTFKAWRENVAGEDGNMEKIDAALNTLDAGKASIEYVDDKVSNVLDDSFWYDSNLTAADMDGLVGVAYGGGVFVVISAHGAAFCSRNGFDWTAHSLTETGNDANWRAVCYGGGGFVAVSDAGKVAYSADGTAWTAGDTSGITHNHWSCVTYGNGMFVAVCEGRYAMYSSDGSTWTETSLPESAEYCSVAYCSDGTGRNLFCAVASDSDRVVYSSDGITWRSIQCTAFVSSQITVNHVFGYMEESGLYNGFVYATDHEIWYDYALSNYDPGYESFTPAYCVASTSGNWVCTAFGNGRFITVNDGRVYQEEPYAVSWKEKDFDEYTTISTNGTACGVDYSLERLNAITYGNSRFIAISEDHAFVYCTKTVKLINDVMAPYVDELAGNIETLLAEI